MPKISQIDEVPCQAEVRILQKITLEPYAHSDHDCITLAIGFDKIHRGPGYWVFNNMLFLSVKVETSRRTFEPNVEAIDTALQMISEN